MLEASGLSEAEKERVRAESQGKGLGAALGVLGGLVQTAQERAQILMKEISPPYRSNVLPLEPVHKEILYYLSEGNYEEAWDVIPKLWSGR